MNYKIKQIEPFVDDLELKYLEMVIKDKWITEGPFSKKFIQIIKDYTNSKYALLVNNGTLGLYLSLIALGIKRNDEVIVPNFTFMASASSVIFAGCTPVFVDVFRDDYHINYNLIEDAITERTKAIMPVHIYGQCAEMDPILEIAKKYNLSVIEDAAQGFGVFYNGIHTGTLGDIGVISFFADKTITMGEGGVIVTSDDNLYQKLILLRNQGRPNSGSFTHPALGMNFRITDMQSALGVAQFEKFELIKEKKDYNLNKYRKYLSKFDEVKFMKDLRYCNYVPFRCAITSKDSKQICQLLEENGVQTRNFFYPLHRQPCLKYLNYKDDHFPVSIELYETGIALPIHHYLKGKDIKYICDVIISYYV